MILQALAEHYQRLIKAEVPGVAQLGYSLVDVSYVLVLSADGEMIDFYPFEGKQMVPEHKKRQGRDPIPYFLCDKVLYSLGIGGKEGEGEKRFQQYRDYNIDILSDASSDEAVAVKKFLERWNPRKWDEWSCLQKYANDFNKPATLNVIYQIDGCTSFIHQNKQIKDLWKNRSEENLLNVQKGQCLITGELETIAKTHDVGISGISEKANAALVSFNCPSFESYGKKQSYNAPVSQNAAFSYATVLNHLVKNPRTRIRIGDMTIVFWADKANGEMEESLLSWWLDPVEEDALDNDTRRLAPEVVNQAKAVLEKMKQGMKPGSVDFSSDVRCYLLGLAPNAARLSVRFWQVNSFGELAERIGQHYLDLQIIGLERYGTAIAPWRILKELAVQRDSKNIPPLLGGQLLQSILSGRTYPQTLYQAALSRCRVGGDHGGVTAIRAAVVKACLLRKYRIQKQATKEAAITVSLDTKNTIPAYLLGRLFSILEKAQKDALGGNINATIRERYFGAASATPGAVFPLLLRLSRHHLNKAQYGSLLDRKIQDILGALDAKPFPAHLNLEEQGVFILGYYHQNQANYEKGEDKKVKEDNGDE